MSGRRRGLRGAAIALVCAAAVALPAAIPATAGMEAFENDYEGRAERDPGTYFGFDLVREDGKRKVAKVTALLAYSCDSGSGGRGLARARGKLAVKASGRFAGRLSVPENQVPVRRGEARSLTYDVTGRLRRRGRARGTIDAVLLFVGAPRGGSTRCYSGRVDWRARRGAEVEVPARQRLSAR